MYRDELEALRARNQTLSAELELERRRRAATEAETEAIRAAAQEAQLHRRGPPQPRGPLPVHLLTVTIAVLSTMTMSAFIWAAHQQLRADVAQDPQHCEMSINMRVLDKRPQAGSPRVGRHRTLGREPVRELTGAPLAALQDRYGDEINDCYEAARRRKPRLAGRIDVVLEIGPRGQVTAARAEDSTVSDRHLVNCVLQRLRHGQWFPEVGRLLRFPLTFQPPDEEPVRTIRLFRPPAEAR